jgi:hypothetical protein
MLHDLSNLPTGWHWRETPGHGYLIPNSQHNENVPAFIRRQEYEEDCAYAIPVVFNKHLFTPETAAAAEETFKQWHPQEYERAFKVKLNKGESYIKDNYFFTRMDNAGKFERCSSFGDWCYQVPKGYVYAYFTKVLPKDASYKINRPSGETVSGLITNERYHAGDYFNLDEILLFNRDESFYTWEEYTKKTGQAKYDILHSLQLV